MRYLLLGTSLAVIFGCGPQTGHAVKIDSMAALRSPQGVCAETGGQGSGHASVCLAAGAPKNLNDDGKTPVMHIIMRCDNAQMADIGNWRVTVWRSKKVIFQDFPTKSYPLDVNCQYFGYGITTCIHQSQAASVLTEPWTPGLYDIEMVYKFNTDKIHRMTISLSGAPS